MRIVEFDLTYQTGTSKIAYPDDISKFRNTLVAGNKVVGEYVGDDQSIQDYAGGWPIREKRKSLTRTEFLMSFTPQEFAQIKRGGANDDRLTQLFDVAFGASEIDLTDPITVDGMAYLVSSGKLTQQRHDEIMEGL